MTITITWKRVVAAVVAGIAAVLLVSLSGVINLAATSGHWPITTWFLHWTMQNSVRTYAAFGTPDKVIDDTGMVSAAGHFAQSCVACHGAPGVKPLPVMQAATPHAPYLATIDGKYTDAELFRILDHGIKYTGMPAWGARNREDEVRRMVAFVRAMPRMTPAQYRGLTAIDPAGADVAARCVGCHGADGRGRNGPDIPILGGQQAAYLRGSLIRYHNGARASGVMQQAAATLDSRQMATLADRFAAMPGLTRGGGVAPGDRSMAATIVRDGLPREQLPACQSCHDPAGAKPYPVLRGQKASYIAQRLRNWRGPEGVVDARLSHDTMPVIARRIPEDQIDAVAKLLAGG